MKNKFLVFIYLIVTLILNIVSVSSGNTDDSLITVGYVSMFVLVLYLIFDYKINARFSFASLFVIVLFVFHFGQLMLLTFFSNVYSHIRFMLLLDTKDALFGFRMMTMALSALCLGILFQTSRSRQNSHSLKYSGLNWESIAKNIIYATFPIKLALDLATLAISFIDGGEAARVFVNTFPNVVLFWGKISLLGFTLLLMAYKYKPGKQLWLFVGMMAYIMFMMLSGIRSENVGYLLVILFIYLQSRAQSLKLRTAVIYGVLGFCALTFVVAAGKFRNYTDKGFDAFMELSGELLTEQNVLLGLFDTCGDTGYTAIEVLNEWLPRNSPTYGDAYYKGIFAIFPNIIPSVIDFGAITEESACASRLQKSDVLESGYLNIGGSYFGEVFMNFGAYGGVFVCFLWGMFFGFISRNAVFAFNNEDMYSMILYISIMLAAVYWVRSHFGGGIREVVWDSLFGYYIVKRAIKSSNLNNKKVAK